MKKITSLICVTVLMLTLLSGCAPHKIEQQPAQPVQQEKTAPAVQITLYAYDAENDDQYATICELPAGQEITAEAICLAYQERVMKGIYHKSVAINSISQQDDKLTIDFKASDVQGLGLGSGSEGNFYGDLAKSLQVNIPTINAIYYTMDGKDFATGHLWFSKSEPFWTGGAQEPVEEAMGEAPEN